MSTQKMTIAQARARIVKIRKRVYDASAHLLCGHPRQKGDKGGERLVLLDELIAFKCAVQRANHEYTLTFAGRTMCLYEAIVRKAEMKSELKLLGRWSYPKRCERLRADIRALSQALEQANNRYHIDISS